MLRFCLSAWCIATVATTSLRSSEPPNIIVIMADDLGYGDLGCYGGMAKTPHLDQLAREGLRFTDFHTNGAVCSPTRAAFLTGRYQQRCGIVTALGENANGLPKREKTVATYLRERNYATALFGKWHLGYHANNSPLHHGFDEFRGHLHGAFDYFSKVDQYGRVDWWHNERPVVDRTYATELITKHSVEFIAANRSRPFFAFIAHSAIHFPWQAPEDPVHRQPGERYENVAGANSKLGPHSGDVGMVVIKMIESLDQGVGRIIAAVKQAQLHRNTLVFFTSDNGGYRTYSGGYTNISSNGHLRGAKGSVYEGGHRVPAIAWWPGRIPAGTVTDATAITMDLLPTFLELAGIEQPAAGDARGLDGVSLVPTLFAGKMPAARDLFWRLADGRGKAALSGSWKLIVPAEGAPELYNLSADVGESHNLAPDERGRVASLHSALSRWEKNVDATQPK
jgi:arylsulfatase A